MIEAAKCMFRKLLGEVSGDLERVTPQPHESLHIETTRNKRRCSRSETPSEKPCSRSDTLIEKPCSRPETQSEKSAWQPTSVRTPPSPPDRSGIHPNKMESVSKTQLSSEPLEQAIDGGFRKQLVLSVPQYELGEWNTNSKCRRSLRQY